MSPENCREPATYPLYYVDSYGKAVGEKAMKEQIAAFGPIACGIQSSGNMEMNYQSGVWQETLPKEPVIDHEVSVVGWGTDSEKKLDYWIVRQAFGTYWGE